MRIKISFCLALLAVVCCAVPAFAIQDGILAVVNDDVITVKDLRDYMKSVYAQLRIEGKAPQEINEIMGQYEEKGINQIIDDRLILAAANKAGVQVRPKAIEDRLQEIRGKYATSKDFSDALLREGLTISDVKKKIEDQFKGQVIINQEVRGKVYINPQEVTEEFNANIDEYRSRSRVYISSIFVKSVYGKEEARQKIDKALAEIKAGADFKVVASKYSELPSIGKVFEEDLRAEMKKTIDALAVWGVSEVVEAENGFYIFKLEGRIMGKDAALKDVKDEIFQKLFEQKFKLRFKTWIEQLREKAYVEIKA